VGEVGATLDACIICKLLDGSEPARFVYPDDQCAAFMDTQPVNPGHILVTPNKHVASIGSLQAEVAAHTMRIAQRLATTLRDIGMWFDGVSLFLADGEAAGQEAFRLRLHLFPRYLGDGFGLHFGPDYVRRERAELDLAAKQIDKCW
jgi:histidine triad (HIT) family protein